MKHLYILFLFLTFSTIAQDKTVVMPNGSSIPEWVNLTEIESTLTPGSVIFAGTSGVLSQDASNLFFENSTDRLGVGTNAAGLGPEASVTAVRSINGTSLALWGANVSTGTSAVNAVRVANNAGNVFDMRMHGTNHSSLPAVGMMLATGSGGLYLSTESTQTIFVSNSGSSNILARFTNTGVGIAGVTVPSAMLHLPAGTATAGTAPMKLTTGTALTTPADGALEYHSSHLYFTIGSTRYQLDQQTSTSALDVDLAATGNVTTGEDNIYSYTLPASTLTVDEQSIRIRFAGQMANNGNTKTLRIKFGGTTIQTRTITTPTSGTNWTCECEVYRTSATTQDFNCTFVGLDPNANASNVGTASETLSGTIAITVTGDATDTNDIIRDHGSVRIQN